MLKITDSPACENPVNRQVVTCPAEMKPPPTSAGRCLRFGPMLCRIAVALALVWTFAGCGLGNGSAPALKPGDELIVYEFGNESAMVFTMERTPKDGLVPVGTRVMWLDGGHADKNRGPMERVRTLDGAGAGEVFLIQRDRLRPVAPRSPSS